MVINLQNFILGLRKHILISVSNYLKKIKNSTTDSNCCVEEARLKLVFAKPPLHKLEHNPNRYIKRSLHLLLHHSGLVMTASVLTVSLVKWLSSDNVGAIALNKYRRLFLKIF